MKSGLVLLCQSLCCGEQKEQGQQGASIGQCYRWAPAVPGGLCSCLQTQQEGLASVPFMGLLLPPKKHNTWGGSSSAFTPSMPGRNLRVRNHLGFRVKSDPALPVKVTRCCGLTSRTGPGRAIAMPPKRPALPARPVQMAHLEMPPWRRRGGDADRPNLLPSAKDKTSRKPCCCR